MRLFVSDVDGTLIPRGTFDLSPIDIKSINKILERGDAFVIASGRPYCSIKSLMGNFTDQGHKFLIGANGAASYQMDGTPINQNTLTLDDLYYFQNKYKGSDVVVYGYDTKSGLVVFEESVCTEIEMKLCGIKKEDFTFVPKGKKPDGLEIPLLKVIIGAYEEISSKLSFNEKERETYTINRSDPCYIEVLKKGSDKGYQVEELRKYLGIKKEDVYCFGDAGNDLTMIRDNHGVAMGNATDDVKKVAEYVTKDVKEQGVTAALRHYGFVD